MPTELEAKLHVNDHAAVREHLRAAGAEPRGSVLETNTLLDTPDGQLHARGCGLRVRLAVCDDTGELTCTVTYKGPRSAGVFKQREEIETTAGDGDALRGLFYALGYTRSLIFEKRRETWALNGCLIELDEVPQLGRFVEVEGPDEQAIHNTIDALDLNAAERVVDSYAALLAATAAEGATELVFRF